MQQIVRRLLQLQRYRKPTKDDNWQIDLDDCNYENELARLKANGGNFDLPPLSVKRYDPIKSTVECESFTVSLK